MADISSHSFDSGKYGGGVFAAAAAISNVLLRLQEYLKIKGDIAEIGVLEGAYLSLLIPDLNQDETVFAIDPYEGISDLKDQVRCKLEGMSLGSNNIRFLYDSSINVNKEKLTRKETLGIRFFSVDGNHAEEFVLNDLLLARDTIVDGGIVAVDDYFDKYSPGVSVAFTKYFINLNQGRLAVLISGGNKVFLTTKEHHSKYRFLLEKFSTISQAKSHPDVEWHGSFVMLVENMLEDFLPI